MLFICRLMILTHHDLWAIIAVFFIGVALLIAGSYIHNKTSRFILLAAGTLTLLFVSATGVSVGPLDNWQHRQGSCLLNALNKK